MQDSLVLELEDEARLILSFTKVSIEEQTSSGLRSTIFPKSEIRELSITDGGDGFGGFAFFLKQSDPDLDGPITGRFADQEGAQQLRSPLMEW